MGANAAHITRALIDTYLITHPHLDHISGFVVNTAGLPATKPKRLAGLPATISAFSNHIFNNVIWPNLSDERNGAGLVTYMRLVDGGSPAIGDGDGRGYVEICEGLSTRPMSVSHGHCLERHSHRGSNAGALDSPNSPRSSSHSNSFHAGRINISPERHQRRGSTIDEVCVYDSCAYFVRDIATGQEVLIFGDVEPDVISLSPRNLLVWKEAAPKIASGKLSAIFIECSYSDVQKEEQLYGHLAPRYLIEEMKVLASTVMASRLDREPRKRKRSHDAQILGTDSGSKTRSSRSTNGGQQILNLHTPRSTRIQVDNIDNSSSHSPVHIDVDTTMDIVDSSLSLRTPPQPSAHSSDNVSKTEELPTALPLQGLKIVIIHVKDKFDDGPPVEQTILQQLLDYESQANLGCEFVLASPGMSVYV